MDQFITGPMSGEAVNTMYARGMTMCEILGFLQQSDGVQVAPEFIRSVTAAVMAEMSA